MRLRGLRVPVHRSELVGFYLANLGRKSRAGQRDQGERDQDERDQDEPDCGSLHGAGGRGSPDLYVAAILSLTVSRRQLKKRPQPTVWRQRSAWTPRVLSRK